MVDAPTGRASVFTLDHLNVLTSSANRKFLYAKNKSINCKNLTKKEQKITSSFNAQIFLPIIFWSDPVQMYLEKQLAD